jgi:hypothetical protein
VQTKDLVLNCAVVEVERTQRQHDPAQRFASGELSAVADEHNAAPDQQRGRDDVEGAV